MRYSFPHYLTAKQTVDDRALNQHVLTALKRNLRHGPIRIIEVGAGMGNMLARLVSWNVITRAEYVHVDALEENIRFADKWMPQWAQQTGMSVERKSRHDFRMFDKQRDVRAILQQADVFDFIRSRPAPADLLIAHAFLDLLPMRESMTKLLSLTRDMAWLTMNFDGVTTFEPVIDSVLDEKIEKLYHHSMDTRPTGGDSRAGRHLFGHLRTAGAKILAAGSSDWVVHAVDGRYPADEAYFLHFILHFFEESLSGHMELDRKAFMAWLKERRQQIGNGQLVYIAHQMDFLARV